MGDEANSVAQLEALPRSKEERAASVAMIEPLRRGCIVVPGIKGKQEAGICVNHRFLPAFKSSAPVNGSFLLQDRLARANTSTGSGGAWLGVQVPKTRPRCCTWSGSLRRLANCRRKSRTKTAFI